MRRPLSALLLLFLVAAALPALPIAHAQGTPQTTISSQYILNRYGYAVVNETVVVRNNGSSSMQIPDMQFGLGNLTSSVVNFNVVGSGYSVTSSTGSQGQVYTVSGGTTTLSAGANSTFSFVALLNGVTRTSNGSMMVTVLERPYLSFRPSSGNLVVQMPSNTQFKSPPSGFKLVSSGSNMSYTQAFNGTGSQAALTQSLAISNSASGDFHPVAVQYASRQIVFSANGSPLVRDSITLQNLGTTELDTLTVAPLTSVNGPVSILPSANPPTLSVAHVSFNNKGIDLTNTAIGQPLEPGANLTIVYEYPLAKQYYSISGGMVTATVPLKPPIAAFVESFNLGLSLPPGVKAVQGGPQTMSNVQPFASGTTTLSYGLSIGWAIDGSVPAASSLFVILLVGLFAARTRMAPAEEEEEEETATERSTDMVKAFEEKTSLINGMFEDIPKTDPNQLGKAYFDELRGRLDTYRSRALQRLNEMKQKSTTQKFFDLLGQIHETEREVDRAAKDMLNLYEQFYTKRMRQEVFDRLLPNYKRRLEKALDKLSDELNTAQRESKLL